MAERRDARGAAQQDGRDGAARGRRQGLHGRHRVSAETNVRLIVALRCSCGSLGGAKCTTFFYQNEREQITRVVQYLQCRRQTSVSVVVHILCRFQCPVENPCGHRRERPRRVDAADGRCALGPGRGVPCARRKFRQHGGEKPFGQLWICSKTRCRRPIRSELSDFPVLVAPHDTLTEFARFLSQGQTVFDLCDPDLDDYLDELKEKQATVSVFLSLKGKTSFG